MEHDEEVTVNQAMHALQSQDADNAFTLSALGTVSRACGLVRS